MLRKKVTGGGSAYHCMTRTVNGEMLFEDRDKEVLRKMLWQVAQFCGAEVLTYCVMSNHFHVLLRFPDEGPIADAELLRRYKVLYPKPTKYQTASTQVLEAQLLAGGEDADEIRRKLRARMGDVSEFMKTLKQRFSVWYNRNHERYGTLWADRFKSVLVEGHGNPLQTIAAYIDLNPVRAGLVEDPKGYRFCGYAEAVAGVTEAQAGLIRIWSDRGAKCSDSALQAHRQLIFGTGAKPMTHKGQVISRETAVKVLEEQQGELSKAVMLRCRVRYFTDGAILGSTEFVSSYVNAWRAERGRKHPPRVYAMHGSNWGDIAVIQSLRRQVFD